MSPASGATASAVGRGREPVARGMGVARALSLAARAATILFTLLFTSACSTQPKPEPAAQSKPASKAVAKPSASTKSAPMTKQTDRAKVALPPPAYAEIAKTYNERTKRLQRLWCRAVVSVDFTDDEGKRRWEQGEGHFQVVQPSRMALSAGKLGEVMLWIGCDAERYWFIDAKESDRAWVGRHTGVTREKIERLGMPAAPRDLLALAGITPLPTPALDPKRDPQVKWSADRKTLSFELTRAGARWRYFVNARNYEPSRIEVVDSASGESVLSATLENYGNVSLRGDGSLPPRVATRMRCLHHPSGSTLGLGIADMSDGGKPGGQRLAPDNFNFDVLRDRLGIKDVVDVDASPLTSERAQK